MKPLVPHRVRMRQRRQDSSKQSVRAKPDASAPARTVAVQLARLVSCVLCLCAGSVVRAGDSPFAEQVLEYLPAPGFLVQDSFVNNPLAALGAPEGAGLLSGAAPDLVTLGGFGGTITLRFDHMVEDDPLNPFGMDAIVFGNAFWLGFSIPDADHLLPLERLDVCASLTRDFLVQLVAVAA